MAVIIILVPAAFGAVPADVATGGAHDPGWPREFDRNGAKLIVYQPQIQSWERFRMLKADTAVSITPSGQKQPVLGVISWEATTVPDLTTRTVAINDIHVIGGRFPSLSAAAATAMQEKVTQSYPSKSLVISLDRMLAGFKAKETATAPPLNTAPPPIYVSMSPAILLFVDGDPVRVPIGDTGVEYVVNTTWDLFYSGSQYYLLDEKQWLTARALTGPWTATTSLPAGMAKISSGGNWPEVTKALPAKAGGPAPKVFFTSKPAELLVFKGSPAFSPIPKTGLAYATNTSSNVFKYGTNHQFYVLISGRWFQAASLDGPWTYAGGNLPDDFKNIPSNSPAASVLASVPNTQDAHDAVLVAQVPTVAVVNKQEAEAKVKVQYTGTPKFEPIQSTSLSYAVNTNDRVIKVGDLYYLCFQGVWFMSTSPSGPWKTADSVPSVIYTIPPSSPVYNVTYVTVSDPTPTTVVTSYTAGYTGMFVIGVGVGATVVYGTGYYYPPVFYPWPAYRYPIYYPYPYTYGVGAYYHPYTGAYSYSQVVYGPYASAGRTAWYNPTTGAYGRAVTYQNAYGGSTYAQGYNPWTGTYGATQQHHNAYSQWGSSVVSTPYQTVNTQHYANANGAVGQYQTSKGGSGTGAVGPNGNTYYHGTTNNGTQYAGKDGNAYKQNPDGTWSKYNNGSWTPVSTSQAQQQVKQNAQNSKAGQNVTKSTSTTQTKNGGSATSTTYTGAKGGSASSVTGPGGDTGYVAKGANNNLYAGKDGNVYKQDSGGGWSKYDNGSWNQVSKPNTQQLGSTSGAGATQGQSPRSGSGFGGSSNVSSDTAQQLRNDSNARSWGNSRSQGSSRRSSGGRNR